MSSKTITVPAKEYEAMKLELEQRRLEALNTRLVQGEENLKMKKFTRADLGF